MDLLKYQRDEIALAQELADINRNARPVRVNDGVSAFKFEHAHKILCKFREADPDEFFSFFEKLHLTHNWRVNIIAPSLPTKANHIYLSKDDDVPYDDLRLTF